MLKEKIENIRIIFRNSPNILSWLLIFLFIIVGLSTKYLLQGAWPWVESFSHTVFLGITAALFTRLLGGMGVFRDAISDMFISDTWIKRRKDLPKVWAAITREIFLPGYGQVLENNNNEFSSALDQALTRAIKRSDRTYNYYVSGAIRILTIGWYDKSKSILKVTDEYSLIVNPFNRSKPCSYDFEIDQDPNKPSGGSGVSLKSIMLGGNALSPAKHITSLPRGRYSVKIPINPKDGKQLERSIEYYISLDDGPLIFITSGRFTLGMTVNVIKESNASDLSLNFIEIGMENVFIPVGQDTAERIARRTAVALLPDQGFVVSAQRAVAPEPQPVEKPVTT